MAHHDTATPRHARTRTMRGVGRAVAIAIATVLGFSLVYSATVADRLASTLNANAQDVDELVGDETARPTKSEPADPDAGEPLTILLIASDVRSGTNGTLGGGASIRGMRNDATMLMHVSGDRQRIEVVSIPRDAQVDIPECTYLDGTTVAGGYGDFNVAFANGGAKGDTAEAAACTIKTVEQLTDVRIDHYAVVDFQGFADVIDALGGVPMCITESVVSEHAHLDIEAGPKVLDGKTALAYARLRTAEEGDVSGSDLQRITRQQQLVHQVVETVMSKNILTDVGQLTRFLRAIAESLSMDTALADTSYLMGLAYSVRGLSPNDVEFVTVPWEYTEDFLNVEILPEAEDVWDDIRNDRPIEVTETGDSSSAWDDGKKDETDPSTPSPTSSAEPSATADTTAQDLLAECR